MPGEELFHLETTENSYSYAPMKYRLYAFLLDYFIFLIYAVVVVGTASIIFRTSFLPLFTSTPWQAQLTGFFIITLPFVLYFGICEWSKWQGTIGKQVVSLQVVNHAGKQITVAQSIIRSTIKFLPWEIGHFCVWHLTLSSSISEFTIYLVLGCVYFLVALYLILPFTNKKRKNVCDWCARTVVIRKKAIKKIHCI